MSEDSEDLARAALGGRLAQERARLGLGISEAARSTKISRRAWHYYESGQTTPGALFLAELDALGFDILFIVAGRLGRPLRSHYSETFHG
ncbi:TPA: helix-turn-helix transcriptional regulator [Pseudomonas aeruginosa]|nr:helix-turn-helix transcriptional regulator [Pseudomonas aeruginosa]